MQLLLGNAVGSLRIQERKIITTHTHPAKGTDCSSYPFYVFSWRNPWIGGGGRYKKTLKTIQPKSPGCMSVAGTGRRKVTLFPSSPLSVGPGCKQRVVWELSQEFQLTSSLCYLFLYSLLIFTIERTLGPWEVKLQKWRLGWEPMWGVSSLTVQGMFHRPVCILVVMLLWTDHVSDFTHIMYPSLLWPTQFSERNGRRVTFPTVQRCSALWLSLTNPDRTAPKLDIPTEGEQVNQRKPDLCFPDPTSGFL